MGPRLADDYVERILYPVDAVGWRVVETSVHANPLTQKPRQAFVSWDGLISYAPSGPDKALVESTYDELHPRLTFLF